MRRHSLAVALGAAMLFLGSAGFAPVAASANIMPTVPKKQLKAQKRRGSMLHTSAPRYRRSRGPQAKPKKRPNMRLVSKRVRRKHRRAA